MHGLVLCIKLENFVAHMFYEFSFIRDKAVPMDIKKKEEKILEYIH